MKTTGLILCTLILFIFACNNESKNTTSHYDSMHFVRHGGGDIDFALYPTENIDQINATVSSYNFQDTTIQLSLEKNSDNAYAFESLQDALNNHIQLNGSYQQPTGETGTWVYIYFVSEHQETEVTNTELRTSLLSFEQMVRVEIQDKR